MKVAIKINAFTHLILENIRLREMQVANPRQTYSISDADQVRPEIEMHIRPMCDFELFHELYNSPETGYIERKGHIYYRNCNIINDIEWPDVLYRGRLPRSFLRIRFESFEPLRVDVQCTSTYLWESRSRLTRIPTLDETINNLLLVLSIFRNYIPMHAAAIECPISSERYSVLFMGLPNTGKTGTSVAVRNAIAGEYLSEDICFVKADTHLVCGGPFTLDETKDQNYNELRATKYIGAALKLIVLLRRTLGAANLQDRAIGDPAINNFLQDMNRYEFEWNHDVIVRHLLIGAAAHGYSNIKAATLYIDGIRKIAEKIPAVELSGINPAPWGPMLVDYLKNSVQK